MTKEVKIYNGEKAASSIKGVQRAGQVHAKKKKSNLDNFLKPCTKINSKWTEDLNVRPKITKILGKNIDSMLFGQYLSL